MTPCCNAETSTTLHPYCMECGCDLTIDSARVVLCETCGSEGRLYHWSGRYCRDTGAPLDIEEPCPYCEGTGGELIETQPIDMADLDAMAEGAP